MTEREPDESLKVGIFSKNDIYDLMIFFMVSNIKKSFPIDLILSETSSKSAIYGL